MKKSIVALSVLAALGVTGCHEFDVSGIVSAIDNNTKAIESMGQSQEKNNQALISEIKKLSENKDIVDAIERLSTDEIVNAIHTNGNSEIAEAIRNLKSNEILGALKVISKKDFIVNIPKQDNNDLVAAIKSIDLSGLKAALDELKVAGLDKIEAALIDQNKTISALDLEKIATAIDKLNNEKIVEALNAFKNTGIIEAIDRNTAALNAMSSEKIVAAIKGLNIENIATAIKGMSNQDIVQALGNIKTQAIADAIDNTDTQAFVDAIKGLPINKIVTALENVKGKDGEKGDKGLKGDNGQDSLQVEYDKLTFTDAPNTEKALKGLERTQHTLEFLQAFNSIDPEGDDGQAEDVTAFMGMLEKAGDEAEVGAVVDALAALKRPALVTTLANSIVNLGDDATSQATLDAIAKAGDANAVKGLIKAIAGTTNMDALIKAIAAGTPAEVAALVAAIAGDTTVIAEIVKAPNVDALLAKTATADTGKWTIAKLKVALKAIEAVDNAEKKAALYALLVKGDLKVEDTTAAKEAHGTKGSLLLDVAAGDATAQAAATATNTLITTAVTEIAKLLEA